MSDKIPAAEKSDVDKLREEFDAKYKAFEDAHRDQVKAFFNNYRAAITANPVAHVITAALGAAALKFWPVVAKWVF